MGRRINPKIAEKFVTDLKEGILKDLLIELKNDSTLMLDFRTKYINIYYRGGWICYLEYKSLSNTYLSKGIDPNYVNKYYEVTRDNSYDSCKDDKIIKTEKDCKELVKIIEARKRVMDYHRNNENNMELENKQIIIRENNFDIKSNYTIIDTEYHTKNSGQPDMIGVCRTEKNYQNLKLAIIEVKFGTKAFHGDSGVYGHFNKITQLQDTEIIDLKEDARDMLKYNIQLELIKTSYPNDTDIKISNEPFELIYFISDISKDDEQKLRIELDKIVNDIKVKPELKEKFEVKLFCPYLAGNVMFNEDVIDIETFLKNH